MLTVSKTAVMNIVGAICGARNPMNSWSKSDSYTDENGVFHIGPEDIKLGHRLAVAGSDHRKFLRQIFVIFRQMINTQIEVRKKVKIIHLSKNFSTNRHFV